MGSFQSMLESLPPEDIALLAAAADGDERAIETLREQIGGEDETYMPRTAFLTRPFRDDTSQWLYAEPVDVFAKGYIVRLIATGSSAVVVRVAKNGAVRVRRLTGKWKPAALAEAGTAVLVVGRTNG